MQNKLEEFCGQTFWDNNITWYTNDPKFTDCFNKTVMVWIPPVFLLIFSPLIISSLFERKTRNEWNWNLFNISKQLLSLVQIVLTFFEVITIVIKYYQNRYIDLNPSLPDICGAAIRFLFSISIFLLFLIQIYKSLLTSGVIWTYFLLSLICGIPSLYAYNNWYSADTYEWIYFLEHYIVTLVLFCMSCFADSLHQNEEIIKEKIYCPKESASFLSRLTYNWFTSLIISGWKKPLTVNDLWEIRERDRSSANFRLFDRHWNSNKIKQKVDIYNTLTHENETNSRLNNKFSKNVKPGTLKTIAKTFWSYFLIGGFYKLMSDLFTFINPQIMKLLMAFISDTKDYEWHGYLYAVLLFIVTMAQILFLNRYHNSMLVIGMRIRSCLVSAVYRKSLRLSNAARNEATTGEIVNLMAVDTPRLADMASEINVLWSAPLQILLSLWFLWLELGVSVFAGLAVMLIMIPINGYLTSISKRLQTKQMKFKDERVKAINEMLSGIKVLKLYAWEKAFMSDVLKIRDKELNNLKKINNLSAVIQCLWYCAPFLVSFITFAIYVLISDQNVLTAEKAFVSLALFNILRVPLTLLPNLINTIITASVSVKRLNKFLNASELSGYLSRKFHEKLAIDVQNASFSWIKESESDQKDFKSNLQNLNIKIAKNSFVAIVGSVGCGKSSLLSAILGDMEIESGSINVCSSMKISYVPQQAWIQNESLKNNILFGNTYDMKRYDEIIKACALEPDISILPGGDETEIGEKGINLSGGQKQRMSLARACFSDSNLYLFDDPLSAVDSHVGKHIFEEVMDSKTGILKDKTRVLVTNSLSVLPFTDQIIVLKDGKISEIGTYNELLKRKQHFFELIKQYSTKTVSTDNGMEWNGNGKEDKLKDNNEIQMNKTELVEVEKAETGRVKFSVYKRYFKAISVQWCSVIVLNYALMQASIACSNVWLSDWTEANDSGDDRTAYYLIIYGLIGSTQTIFVSFGWLSLTRGIIKASKSLHFQMLDRILRSPMAFFDTTPIGRILNRFSKDVDTCDNVLHFYFRLWLVGLFQLITTIIIISAEIPMFLVILLPIVILFYIIQKFYIITARQLKRLESITKSPIYSHFSETLSGVTTIRAFGVNEKFTNESDERIDTNNRCFFASIMSNRWIALRLEIVSNFIVFFSALFAVIYRHNINASQVGLIITYALNSTQTLNWFMRNTCEIENNIVGVERILEYTDLKTEAEWDISETSPQSTWPFNGNISFSNYSTKYRSGLDLVLKQISFDIKQGEKIGIVGRTGAGKSSLTLGLFRLIEPTDGQIVIDGINVCDIGLHQLRSKLTIIPQDPVLFSGSIRSNLDPFGVYSDEQLWNCLELSHLKTFVKSLDSGLEHKVSEGGENLSVGQRQLICLARALLRNTKVLILDEATAAVDLETDALIQSTIRKTFSDSTVLTIAHRLHTIMDSNRVLVLNEGKVVEYDSPNNLLANSQSIFHSLAKDAGIIR